MEQALVYLPILPLAQGLVLIDHNVLQGDLPGVPGQGDEGPGGRGPATDGAVERGEGNQVRVLVLRNKTEREVLTLLNTDLIPI